MTLRYVGVLLAVFATTACETTTEVRNVTCRSIVAWSNDAPFVVPGDTFEVAIDSIAFYDCSSPEWDGEKIRVAPR